MKISNSLGMAMVLTSLIGCQAEQSIDPEKIESAAFDAHFVFFDEELNLVQLNAKEADIYYQEKQRDELEFLEWQSTFAIADDIKRNAEPQDPNGPAEVPDNSNDGGTGSPPPTPNPAANDPATATSGGGTPPSSASRNGGGLAYKNGCVEKGVPIPPPFGQPDWEELDPLPKDKIFSDPKFNPLYIWRYESSNPEGICAATVRYKEGKPRNPDPKKVGENVEVVGIICQGKKSGNACFWATRHSGKKFGANVEEMMDGNTIPTYTEYEDDKGKKVKKPLKCTFCHLGSNAFVVHPGTSLSAFEQDPAPTADNRDRRYKPVSGRYDPTSNDGDKWSNPENSESFSDDGCGGCHLFAKVNKVWCRDVLQKTLYKTMPPDSMRSGNNWKKNFSGDLAKLAAQCLAAGYTLSY